MSNLLVLKMDQNSNGSVMTRRPREKASHTWIIGERSTSLVPDSPDPPYGRRGWHIHVRPLYNGLTVDFQLLTAK